MDAKFNIFSLRSLRLRALCVKLLARLITYKMHQNPESGKVQLYNKE